MPSFLPFFFQYPLIDYPDRGHCLGWAKESRIADRGHSQIRLARFCLFLTNQVPLFSILLPL